MSAPAVSNTGSFWRKCIAHIVESWASFITACNFCFSKFHILITPDDPPAARIGCPSAFQQRNKCFSRLGKGFDLLFNLEHTQPVIRAVRCKLPDYLVLACETCSHVFKFFSINTTIYHRCIINLILKYSLYLNEQTL